MLQQPGSLSPASPEAIVLDPLALLLHASGPVRVVNWTLMGAALAVWIVAVLKLLQLGRMRSAERAFDKEACQAISESQLFAIARSHRNAPSARIVLTFAQEAGGRSGGGSTLGGAPDAVAALAKRAFVLEEQRAGALLGILSTIGSAGPFVGLFGTVWGILDAFLRIGREKSASLPVVAPAIGEALIATAMGLFAAIPAVVLFNIVSKRADDLLARVEAGIDTWVSLTGQLRSAQPAVVPSARPSDRAVAFPAPRAGAA